MSSTDKPVIYKQGEFTLEPGEVVGPLALFPGETPFIEVEVGKASIGDRVVRFVPHGVVPRGQRPTEFVKVDTGHVIRGFGKVYKRPDGTEVHRGYFSEKKGR